MDVKLTFTMNSTVYLKDPEGSEVGRRLTKQSIDLIDQIGFESFTFKKLAAEAETTEATVYRYFENKHRLLLYIISWYWKYLDFYLDYRLQNISNPNQQLCEIVHILTHSLPESNEKLDYDKKKLHRIVITESCKVYLVREVTEINKNEVFKPYKDLCARIAHIIKQSDKHYPFPHSLSITLIETAHQQEFFIHNLPRLTDFSGGNANDYTADFLKDMLMRMLNISAKKTT
ncbi:MAG: TetR family transcriptional regulator [Ferruginibacter sp.]